MTRDREARTVRRSAFVAALVVVMHSAQALGDPGVGFEPHDGSLVIEVSGQPFATYVWRDPEIRRPYFAHLRTPGGRQITRAHPPVEGQDATDHAAMHPGLWLAFGDISGADFWRNKGSVEHVEFLEKPAASQRDGRFVVKNRYVVQGQTICEETCRISIMPVEKHGVMIGWESTFSAPEDFYFGDQEEMGLGVRLATPLTVKNGGQITNSDELLNEKQVWGKQADWCDYSGTIDGKQFGVMILPSARNFRRSWFHARDYGLLVANPFGQKAFTKGAASKIAVPKGETLSLRFDVLVHEGAIDLATVYKSWLDFRSRQEASRK
jgi:hypothetical protein